ncbi:dynein regulatory complex protein 1 homolog [Diabrotica virgifera virgifera]|uniref:Dynein regulatory complex protein 1 homolog n=2 Tax=Diabrotica virgifera virgifera TaxID=50390 RepID=A0ABM5KA34_DIAVI|nr:dynein regulatory complex protein 1 homolog [Diabrotica virgifera virgifera]
MSRLFSIISEIAQIPDTEGPSTISGDAEERKIARRERIERRIAAIKLQQIKDMGEIIEEEKHPVEMQIEKSAEILEKFLQESQESLENTRVANDSREINRREVETVRRQQVIAQLEAEAVEAHKQFNEIAGKWSGIQDYKDPLHIHEDILEQKMKCDELIQQKDEIIEMLKNELRISERKFTMDQTKQNQDISILGQRIEKQIQLVKSAYAQEFNLIEKVITEEKEKYIQRSNENWEELAQKRQKEEVELSEYVFQKREDIVYNIDRMAVYHEDQFRESKIQLELDVQNAQNEFEKIKCLVLSNTERLDYNYQILKRRENENIIMKSQQKRRIGKLQDTISELKSSLANYRENTNKQIKKTSDNILKMHRSILDIDSKADHFALTNEKKFNEVWDLNNKDCLALLDKITGIDKILYQQQLGAPWNPPKYKKIDKKFMSSYNRAVDLTNEFSVSLAALSKHREETQNLSIADSDVESKNPTYNNLAKHILNKLSTKSGFLTEKCLKMLIKTYEDKEQNLVTLNNVFIALDIKRQQDIDLMVEFFLPYCHCTVCVDTGSRTSLLSTSMLSRRYSTLTGVSTLNGQTDMEPTSSITELEEACVAVHQRGSFVDDIVAQVVKHESTFEDDRSLKLEFKEFSGYDDDEFSCYDPQKDADVKKSSRKRARQKESVKQILCQKSHPLVMSTVYVISALKDFVSNYYKQNGSSPTVGERLERKRHTISRLLDEKDIQKYWKELKNVYNEDNTRVWDGLREGLMKYISVLKARKATSEEVLKLRKRNKHLKKLLAEYIDHGVLLKPPPCYVKPDITPHYSISPSNGNE